MKVSLRQISGPWSQGWVLDKHTLKSTFLGNDDNGRAQFETVRSEAGQAAFLLKYRAQWDQVEPLACALSESIWPRLPSIGFIVPMPASRARQRQPVTEIARALGKLTGVPVFENLLSKAATGKLLKDLGTKEEKVAELQGKFSLRDEIRESGKWNVLLLDDLFDTGASMEEACKMLQTYSKVREVFVAALTWT